MSETSNAVSLQKLREARKLTAHNAGGTTVAEFFKHNRQNMAQVLPKHVNADRMVKLALSALRTTPKLMECKLDTLMGAVMTCAQLGLEPNTPLGHAYLIPFRNKKKGITEVQVIPGYKGLIDLARRSGNIKSIKATAVRKGDHFVAELGTEDRIEHRVDLEADRGPIIAFYAVATFLDGGHQFEVMSKREVDAIRARSKSSDNGPWVTDYEQMGRKTVIRRLTNYLPLSIEMARATALDGIAASGQEQSLDAVLEGDYSVIDEHRDAYEDDGTSGADQKLEQADPGADGDHPTADEVVTAIEAAEASEEVSEWMAIGAERFSGPDKAKITRAGNARIEALTKANKPAPAQSADGAPSYAEIRQAIHSAGGDAGQIAEALDMAGHLPDDQQAELKQLANAETADSGLE